MVRLNRRIYYALLHRLSSSSRSNPTLESIEQNDQQSCDDRLIRQDCGSRRRHIRSVMFRGAVFIRHATGRLVRRHKCILATMTTMTILCATMFVALLVTRNISNRESESQAQAFAKLQIENRWLQAQNEILQNLRVDFVGGEQHHQHHHHHHHDHTNDSFGPNDIDDSMIFNYHTLYSRMELAMQTFADFINTNILSRNGKDGFFSRKQTKRYLLDWYRLMASYVDLADTRDRYRRQREQQDIRNTIRFAIDRLQAPPLSSKDDDDNNDTSSSSSSSASSSSPSCIDRHRRYVLCSALRNCGFGCLMHHLAYCLITALALNRTLMVTSPTIIPIWRAIQPPDFAIRADAYRRCKNRSRDYVNDFFERFSATTTILTWNQWAPQWSPGGGAHTFEPQMLQLEEIERIRERMPFRPLAIPDALRSRLSHLTDAPFTLFVGHVLDYLFRPTAKMRDKIDAHRRRCNLSSSSSSHSSTDFLIRGPLVGVHVRRTDKVLESSVYPLADYMTKVAQYFDRIDIERQLMMPSIVQNDNNNNFRNTKKIDCDVPPPAAPRRIYLATDDPDVWTKEVPVYEAAGYRFYGDIRLSANSIPEMRTTTEAVEAIVLDVHMLASVDYLVCAMSSQICRLAYELMQVRGPPGRDMSNKFYSLNDVYYFGGMSGHAMEAIMSHQNLPDQNDENENEEKEEEEEEEEVEEDQDLYHRKLQYFFRNDTLGIYTDLRNGYLSGDLQASRCRNSSATIRAYPKFMVKDRVVVAHFAAFDDL